MDQNLHIVVPDVPFPADTDTSRDIFFRIRALHNAGIGIYLHCFEFGKGQSGELEPFCRKIRYYRRNKANELPKSQFVPYAVSTRANLELAKNLFADDYPILYEGLSTTFPVIWKNQDRSKKQFINVNRNDSQYYKNLFSLMPWGIKKITYLIESWKHERYYKKLSENKDINLLKLEPFSGEADCAFTDKMGSFCLFYGKLSDKEIEYAALWLLENIFNELEIPFVIAGSNPSPQLDQAAHLRMHTCLVAEPGNKELEELIKKAQVVMMPSFINDRQPSHLLRSLSLGRHILTNPKAIGKSGLGRFCAIAETPEEFKEKTTSLFNQPYSESDYIERSEAICKLFDDSAKADQLIRKLNLHGQ